MGKHRKKVEKRYPYVTSKKNRFGKCLFRSSWERAFAVYLDRNPEVSNWTYERKIIWYFNPFKKRRSRYYPDFFVKLRNGKEIIVEIKPSGETKKPVKRGRKKQSTFLYETYMYELNQAKWKSCKEYCRKTKREFKVLTELDLFPTKIRRKI